LAYWQWSLKQEDWYDVLLEEESRLGDMGITDNNRVLKNHAIVAFGYKMFQKFCSDMGLTLGELDGGNVYDSIKESIEIIQPEGKRRNDFHMFLELINRMVNNGEISFGVHYVTSGNKIVFRLDEILDKAKRYRKNYDIKLSILSAKAYRDMAQDSKFFIDWKKTKLQFLNGK